MALRDALAERLKRPRFSRVGYELFVLALSVYVLVILLLETILKLSADETAIIQTVDVAICLVFLGDFVHRMVTAEHRWRYFVTWGWLDLLSSIPMVDALRTFRAARIFRILRLLRAARSSKQIIAFLMARRAQSALLVAIFLAFVLVVCGSIAVIHFEADDPNAQIRTGSDALWWSIVTITTVGYGDLVPVTTGGRAVAGVLMMLGIGIFGTFSGYLASWFLEGEFEEEARGDQALQEEVAALRATVERLATLLEEREPPVPPPPEA